MFEILGLIILFHAGWVKASRTLFQENPVGGQPGFGGPEAGAAAAAAKRAADAAAKLRSTAAESGIFCHHTISIYPLHD